MFFYEATQLSNFGSFLFMEVETITFSVSDLQQIIVKCFLYYSDFSCWCLQVHVYYLPSLVDKAWIKFSPQSNFFDYLLYSFFFLFGLSSLGVFIFGILGLLLFFEKLYLCGYFFAETQFQRELVIIR